MSVKSSALNVERSSAAPPTANLLQALDYSVLQQCMHCGLCLPSCPTYAETGRERNSPRGRISLMRAVADGDLETTTSFAEEMSYCLGCLACTTACPAGVDYTTLLETARAHVEQSGIIDSPTRNTVRAFTLRGLFIHPRLLRAAGRLLWVYQASGLQTLARKLHLTALLPRSVRELEPATPRIQRHFSDALIAEHETPPSRTPNIAPQNPSAVGGVPSPRDFPSPNVAPREPRFHRVVLLTGCVQDLVFSDVNRATADVLLANGCEIVTPRSQHCCGSLHAHNGDPATARLLARRQLDAIDPFAVDAIISNAAGCGSHLKHYDRLLADDPAYATRAAEWSRKLRDISEWLVEIGFRQPTPPEERSTLNAQPLTHNETAAASDHLSVKRSALNVERSPTLSPPSSALTSVTYHEACHLCHGQKISAQPRAILKSLPGTALAECAEATWCCGSAGIYNITQPATAGWLQQRKLGHLRATGASVVATANPGCHLQIQNGLRAAGDTTTEVVHPVVLLARAYAAEKVT